MEAPTLEHDVSGDRDLPKQMRCWPPETVTHFAERLKGTFGLFSVLTDRLRTAMSPSGQKLP